MQMLLLLLLLRLCRGALRELVDTGEVGELEGEMESDLSNIDLDIVSCFVFNSPIIYLHLL